MEGTAVVAKAEYSKGATRVSTRLILDIVITVHLLDGFTFHLANVSLSYTLCNYW